MHELLLFGQVPFAQHGHILKVLAGIAAMQPRLMIEHHLIYMPTRPLNMSGFQIGAKQGVQNSSIQALVTQMHGDLFYLQLVGTVDSDQSGVNVESTTETEKVASMQEEKMDIDAFSNEALQKPASQYTKDGAKGQWSLEYRDLPEVSARRPVTSRLMATVSIVDGDAQQFVEALGYKYVSEYILQGHQFIYNNIILFLYQPLLIPTTIVSDTNHGTIAVPSVRLPPLSSLKPLDPSNTFILQASVRVQDGNKPESMTVGMNELKAFKEMIRGVVEMEVGDRLALDTRVR